jgi:hypothetical protein
LAGLAGAELFNGDIATCVPAQKPAPEGPWRRHTLPGALHKCADAPAVHIGARAMKKAGETFVSPALRHSSILEVVLNV